MLGFTGRWYYQSLFNMSMLLDMNKCWWYDISEAKQCNRRVKTVVSNWLRLFVDSNDIYNTVNANWIFVQFSLHFLYIYFIFLFHIFCIMNRGFCGRLLYLIWNKEGDKIVFRQILGMSWSYIDVRFCDNSQRQWDMLSVNKS